MAMRKARISVELEVAVFVEEGETTGNAILNSRFFNDAAYSPDPDTLKIIWEQEHDERKSDIQVKARCYDDLHIADVDFDAAGWFQQATDDEVSRLAKRGWGGDYPADEVAQYKREFDPQVAAMFNLIEAHNEAAKRDIGFECYVDAESAMAWLDKYRPELAERLRSEDLNT